MHLCEALDGDDARRQAVDVLRRRRARRDLVCLSDTLPVFFAPFVLVHVAAAAIADAACLAHGALKGGSHLLADVGRAGPAVLLWLGDVDDDEILRAIREAKEAKRVCNLYRTFAQPKRNENESERESSEEAEETRTSLLRTERARGETHVRRGAERPQDLGVDRARLHGCRSARGRQQRLVDADDEVGATGDLARVQEGKLEWKRSRALGLEASEDGRSVAEGPDMADVDGTELHGQVAQVQRLHLSLLSLAACLESCQNAMSQGGEVCALHLTERQKKNHRKKWKKKDSLRLLVGRN